MNQQQQPESSPLDKAVGLFYLIFYVMFCCATTIQIWTRIPGTVGRYHFGIRPLIGWIIMLFFCGACGYPTNFQLVGPFIKFSFVVLILHRLVLNQKERHGKYVMSYYIGDSWLSKLRLFQGKDGRSTPEFLSGMLLACIFGMLDCPSLMFWCFICMACNGFVLGYLDSRDKKHERDLIDAKLEQQYWQGRYQHHFEED